jgi:hypothetical protein
MADPIHSVRTVDTDRPPKAVFDKFVNREGWPKWAVRNIGSACLPGDGSCAIETTRGPGPHPRAQGALVRHLRPGVYRSRRGNLGQPLRLLDSELGLPKRLAESAGPRVSGRVHRGGRHQLGAVGRAQNVEPHRHRVPNHSAFLLWSS